jgi:citrate synthase
MDSLLTSEEAANRLGVTVPTLYVYVSRGLIQSHRELGKRASGYALQDVDRLARTRRQLPRGELRGGAASKERSEGLQYRGIPLLQLLDQPVEEIAELLWQTEPGDWVASAIHVPKGLSPVDQIRAAVVLAGSRDAFRSDQRAEAIFAATRRLLAGLARTLARSSGVDVKSDDSLAYTVAAALASGTPSVKLTRAVNALMVLLADHAMSPSTAAVQLAGNTRADLYNAILAGLGVLSGPFYGGGSEAATRLLRYSAEAGVDRAVNEELRWRGSLPGFGLPAYPDGDPRFAMILPYLEALLNPAERGLISDLLLRVAQQQLPAPNMDLALALLVYSTKADSSFGSALFSLARIAGWVKHYRDELEAPRRLGIGTNLST